MRLSLDEAITAATRGGAKALRRHDVGGGVDPQGGRRWAHWRWGHVVTSDVLNTNHAIDLAYRPGMPLTWGTFIDAVPVR